MIYHPIFNALCLGRLGFYLAFLFVGRSPTGRALHFNYTALRNALAFQSLTHRGLCLHLSAHLII